MSNILQFQQKLNYTASDFQVRVSVKKDEYTDYYIYTAQFYIKTTARDLTPTTEEKIGELVVNSEDSSGKTKTFGASFKHNSGQYITVTCQGSLKTSGDGSITIESVSYRQFFDGHLTADSFIITLDVRNDGVDLGESYYSYRAVVAVKPDLRSFFVLPVIANSNYSESDYGSVKYSTYVTFTTKNSETVTVYLTLDCNNGSGSITFDGVSPQWIDAPGRPRLLKYGNKLIKY